VNKKVKRRARNISAEDVNAIVQTIDGLVEIVTWKIVIDKTQLSLGAKYTRQALYKHARIRMAFESARNRKDKQKDVGAHRDGLSAREAMLIQQIERLKSESSRLAIENQRLLEQFSRWAYNSFMRGLTEEYLNQPLPAINRKKTPESINKNNR